MSIIILLLIVAGLYWIWHNACYVHQPHRVRMTKSKCVRCGKPTEIYQFGSPRKYCNRHCRNQDKIDKRNQRKAVAVDARTKIKDRPWGGVCL